MAHSALAPVKPSAAPTNTMRVDNSRVIMPDSGTMTMSAIRYAVCTQAISSELADSPPWIWVSELVTICTSMIAMTRPAHIANTPIQSRSRGFSSGAPAAGAGSAAAAAAARRPPVGAARGAPAAAPEPMSSRRRGLNRRRFGRGAVNGTALPCCARADWVANNAIMQIFGSKRAASAVEPPRPKFRSQVPTSTALLIAGHCESRNLERG